MGLRAACVWVVGYHLAEKNCSPVRWLSVRWLMLRFFHKIQNRHENESKQASVADGETKKGFIFTHPAEDKK